MLLARHVSSLVTILRRTTQQHRGRYHLYEEDEMFERCVEVRLLPQLDNLAEVLVVDVRVHAEQALQNCLRVTNEVLWKWHTCGNR